MWFSGIDLGLMLQPTELEMEIKKVDSKTFYTAENSHHS